MRYRKRVFAILMCMYVCFAMMPVPKQVMAAAEDWKLEVYSQYPLDNVEATIVDENHGDALYFVGYRNGTVAVMDEKQKLVAQTEYPTLEVLEDKMFGVVYANTYYKGKVALVVRTAKGVGMCDLKGKELLPCEYASIEFEPSFLGHGIYTLKKANGDKEKWVDGKYKINHIKDAYLSEYEGEVCIFSLPDNKEDGYTYYDLKGKKIGTLTADEYWHSPHNRTWDLDWYNTACEQWLPGKCQEAEGKVKAYYESLGYGVETVTSFTGYNYVRERKEQMYYYVVVPTELSYATENVKNISLGRTNYVFVYKEDQTLIMEGQTNLCKADREENDLIMCDVVVLDRDGTMQCMNRYTGEIRNLYTTDPKTLFWEKDSGYEEYFNDYHLKGVMEEKLYTTDRAYNDDDDTATYTLEYTRDYLLGIGEEHTAYVLTTGEKVTYDWSGGYALYGIAANEKETQIYAITDKIIPVDKVEVSVETLNQFYYQGCARFKNSLAWIAYPAKKVYLVNEKYCVSWSFEELGITSNDCVIEEQGMYDDFGWISIKEIDYQDVYDVRINYFSFIFNIENGKAKFLGKFEEIPEVVCNKVSACELTLNENYYTFKNNMLYTVDMQNFTIEKKDFGNVFGEEKKERVASLEEINGKPYIRYTTPRSGGDNFYGYMDLQGNVKIDPLLTKVYWNHDVRRDNTKCIQVGEYLSFGRILFDLNFQKVADNMRVLYLDEYDAETGDFKENGLISVYNRYEGEQFLGILYDSNTGKIIKKYEKFTDVYIYAEKYGHYCAFQLSDSEEVAWVDTNTMEEIRRVKGYCYIDRQEKKYCVFQEKTNIKKPDIVMGNSYNVKDAKYLVISVKNRIVSLEECNSTKESFTIPDTVKLKGKTFKVVAIEQDAFQRKNKLTKVVIGKNVTKIGKNAFSNCKMLNSIVVKGKKLTSVGTSALKGTAKKLVIQIPNGKKKAYKKLWKGKGNANVTIK